MKVHYVTNYSFKFRKKIQEIAANAEKIIPSKILKGIGVFLFGSPSRQEMSIIGCRYNDH
jgi:hypothetical protein